MSSSGRIPGTARRLLLTLALASLPFAGPLSAQSASTDVSGIPAQTVWPPPPDPPRVKFVGLYQSSYDVEGVPKKSTVESLREALLGKDQASAGKLGPRRFGKPYGVAVDSKGRVIIADTEAAAVFVLDPVQRRFTELGGGARAQAHLRIPIGVAVDLQDNIYVGDNGHGLVLVFGPDLAFKRALTKPGELEAPTGLAFDAATNRLYVVDTRRHSLSSYDVATGTLVKRIGTKGNKPGEFGWPTGVALSQDGRVYVTDTMNYRVQIFDRDLTYLKSFGSLGVNPGQFRRPKGIAVDEDGIVYVVDSDFNNFQMFDADGRPLLFVGSFGQRPGQMILPAGITVAHRQRRIYVAEQITRRVQVFERVAGSAP